MRDFLIQTKGKTNSFKRNNKTFSSMSGQPDLRWLPPLFNQNKHNNALNPVKSKDTELQFVALITKPRHRQVKQIKPDKVLG